MVTQKLSSITDNYANTQGEQPFVGSGKLRDDDDELRKLRQQVKDLQQENDFLKKASAFFAKNLK